MGWKQSIVLKHVAHLPLLWLDADTGRSVKPNLICKGDRSAIGPIQSSETTQQRSFSRTGWPEQDQHERRVERHLESRIEHKPLRQRLRHIDSHFCGHTAHTFRLIAYTVSSTA